MRLRYLILGCLYPLSVPLSAASDHGPAANEQVPAQSLQWEEIVPGISFGPVYGNWRTGAHGKFVRFGPGVVSPVHRHSGAYHAVVVSGTVINPYEHDSDPPEMTPGDYWSTAAGAVHATGCVSDSTCLVYTHMDGPWDIEVVEQREESAE